MLSLDEHRELKIAPRAVFDALDERGDRPRFYVAAKDGGWRAVTWGEFAESIERVASFLLAAGLEPGDRAAIYAPNRVEWLSAALGIQAAGAVMVPIYPASTGAQAAYVVQHSDARVLFVDTAALLDNVVAAWGDLAKAGVRRVVVLDDAVDLPASLGEAILSWAELLEIGEARASERPNEVAESMGAVSLDRGALMLYTSGTTGRPKGVPLTHRNVAANGLDWLECFAPALEEDAVDLLWLPMSHIFGFGEACVGNTLGYTTYLSDPQSVLSHLREVRPTVFMSVPAYWEKIAKGAAEVADARERRSRLRGATGGRLRFCLSGGAGLKPEIKELYHDAGLLILEGYGLTECSPTLTLNRPGSFRFDTVGLPLPSVDLRLGEDGEILARGPNVFGGYHKDPEATRGVFTDDGWFKTGDLGRFTDDGFLQIVGRKKEILVTAGGKNVPPANIEERFADEPLVDHAVVYGDGKKYLVAGLWINRVVADDELDRRGVDPSKRGEALRDLAAEAVARANEKLARFERIRRFALMDRPLTVAEGHLTSTLKVRRKHVYESFRDELEALYD